MTSGIASRRALPSRLRQLVGSGDCVLFLGAGVSVDAGAPKGQELSDELGRAFFDMPPGYPLAEMAALIDADLGRRRLNEWLLERFEGLSPSPAIALITSFYWKAIYTVNFDTLVEAAYAAADSPIQKLHPIYSDRDPISRVATDEVALYKLHGCLSRPNSEDGRLVLTQDDFARVEGSRRRLFNRLVDHVADLPVIYAGFARADPDFARVLSSVERAVGDLAALSRSYALQPGFLDAEAKRAEMKKVTLIDRGASGFFMELDESIPRDERARDRTAEAAAAVPRSALTARKPSISASVLAALVRDYEIVDDVIDTDASHPSAFYEGSPPSWADIAADVDAKRDSQDSVLDALLVDPELDRSADQLVLLHAEAGAGKTTLLRRLGLELVRTWDRTVIALRPFGALDFLDVERLASAASERVYVIIDDLLRQAGEVRAFLSSARRAAMKVTVLTAARTNEWRESQDSQTLSPSRELEMGALSREEIDGVLDRLAKHDKLGYLKDADRAVQRHAFESRAQKQLLVALREATEGKAFDEIVVDEFAGIPSEDAQRAYLYVAALHRFGLLTRASVLHRAMRVPLADLGRRVFAPAAKIIVPQEVGSRDEFYYRTRHPLIAEIVFDRQVQTEADRLAFYLSLIRELDLGYESDADTYRRLSRSLNRQLLRDFGRQEHKRDLMREIQELDPSDAYVHQHAAMMELSFGDLRLAATHIAKAIEIRPHDAAIRDTEGRIVLAGVERESTTLRKLAKLKEAEAIFARNIERRPSEPYGYRHLAEVYWVRSTVEAEPVAKGRYIGEAYRVLADGLNKVLSSTMLRQYNAELELALGNREEAREVLGRALSERPEDVPLRLMAARLAERSGERPDAIRLLQEGVAASPDSWELHYRLARLLADDPSADDAEVGRHLAAALLAPMRRYWPRLTYAAWLFAKGQFDRAGDQFARLEQLEVPAAERFDPRRFQFGGLGRRHTGRVTRLSLETGHVEFGGGATRVFFRRRDIREGRDEIRIGSELSYELRFNLLGPIARDIRIKR